MSTLKNDRLLKTIRHQPVDATPVWMMRQAGRYLPEYRELRKKAGSFMTLCKTPALAAEVTLQPLSRFPLDAAILFSDILTIPDAMGLGLYFKEGEGPCFERPIRTEKEIAALSPPDPDLSLRYVLDAIQIVQQNLAGKVPLIGFCGSPWTLATYMIEGSANKSFPAIQSLLRENPALLHQLLKTLAQSVSLHLSAQIKAGVNAVMLFDTWGGMLSQPHYEDYSLHYVKHAIANLVNPNKVPVILFTKGGGQWLKQMATAGCDVIGVDSLVNLGKARQEIGSNLALQGNMNPCMLYESPSVIYAEVERILAEYGEGSGHVFNLGHGIPQDVLPEQVAVLVGAVHTLSRRYHEGSSSHEQQDTV